MWEGPIHWATPKQMVLPYMRAQSEQTLGEQVNKQRSPWSLFQVLSQLRSRLYCDLEVEGK